MDKAQHHRSIIEQWLAVGGGWWLVALGSRRLVAVGGGWRLVAVGDWWQLVVGDGWWLPVGGWWSLGAVLKGCPLRKNKEREILSTGLVFERKLSTWFVHRR